MMLSENLYELIPCLTNKENVYNNQNVNINNNQKNICLTNNTIRKNKLSFDNLNNEEYLTIKRFDNSPPIKELIHKKQKCNEVAITYYINNDVKLDNLLCTYCVNGDITNTIFYILHKGVDPFKFNEKYQTNPISLAFHNKHLNIIKIIQKYVYDKKIPYNFNFFCPYWGSKEFNEGHLNFQTRIFQSVYNTIIDAFWSFEIKDWVKF